MHPVIRRLLTGKYFLFFVGALLLYTLVGFFLLPFTIGWYVPKLAHDRFNCQVSLGKIRINPFLMSLEVAEFGLTGSDGAPMAGFERLFLDLAPSGIFRRTAWFSEFRLKKPTGHVVIETDGETNFARLIPKSTEAEPKPPSSPDPIRLLLQTVAIEGGEITVTDRRPSIPKTIIFRRFDLNASALSTLRGQSGTGSLSTTTQNEETFQWQGDIGLAPFRSSGRLAGLNIQAATLWGFVRDRLLLEAPGGRIDVITEYRIDAGSSPLRLVLENCKVGLSGVSLKRSGTDLPFFELGGLDVDSVRLDLEKRSVHVGNVLVDGGMIRVYVDEGGTGNFKKILAAIPAREKKEETSVSRAVPAGPGASSIAPAPWTVDLEAIEIKNIGVHLEDMSRVLPLAAGISSLSIRSKAKMEAGSKAPKVLVSQLGVELKGVRFGSKAAPEPVFSADRFFVDGGDLDLGARTLTISRVGMSDGYLIVGRERDGKLNLANLVASKISARDEGALQNTAVDEGPSWKYRVKRLELSGFQSDLSDHTVHAEKPLYQLQGFWARATDIEGLSPFGVELGFNAAQGGTVAFQGQVDPAAPSVDAKITVSDLSLTPLQPFLEPYVALVLQSAFVSTEGVFRYGVPNAGSKIAYEGSFRLGKLSLNEPGSKETFLGWGALQIPKMKLTAGPNDLKIEDVRLIKLIGRLIIGEDRTVNLATIFKERPAKEPRKDEVEAQGETGGESFPFRIGRVRVEDGNVVFADFSLKPKFMTRIHSLKGIVSGISSSGGSPAGIELDGGVDQHGFVKVTGALDPHDIKRSTAISMVFQNVELTSVTPYSGKFAGRGIKSGKLSMNLDYKIQNNRMLGDNKIIVDNLELGEHVDSPEAVNLPLDLAVALLKDASGKINIGLPVSGDLNDPRFSLGPLIWKAFTSLITKAVTAPFRVLGSLFGGAEETLDAVAFDSGRAELLPPEKEKLKKLSDALRKRPQLKLILQGRYSPEDDGLGFKQTAVRRAVGTLSGEKFRPGEEPGPLDPGDGGTRRALEKLFEERFGAPALEELNRGVKEGTVKPRSVEASKAERTELLAAEIYARLIENEPIPEQALRQLAAMRARSVAVELENAHGIPPNRISIKEPEPRPADEGRFVKLSLDALSPSK